MAAVGSHQGGNLFNPTFISKKNSNHLFSSNPILSISNPTKKIPQKLVLSASIVSGDSSVVSPSLDEVLIGDSHGKDSVFSEKIDYWMQESVSEIVKNLKQAPLLVHIYAEKDENSRMKVKTEKALLDEWPDVKREWQSGNSKSPDGLIFVEELEKEGDQEIEGGGLEEEGVARAWGIVVQRKGVECRPACYLLKTNRVCAGIGLGFCTHFCLMKVNNFRDSALEQFKDSWLLQ